MGSFTKHLSTHVYFHMDRPVPKKTGPPPTGFGMQHTALENTCQPPSAASVRQQQHQQQQQQAAMRSRSKEHVPASALPPTSNAFERLNRTLRAGGDPFQDQVFGNSDEDYESRFDTSDYFSENPYLLSPDFAARDRGQRRKVPWKRSNHKYVDAKSPTQHELQSYGVYSNRFGGEPSRHSHNNNPTVSFAAGLSSGQSDNGRSSSGSGGGGGVGGVSGGVSGGDTRDRLGVRFAPDLNRSRRQSSVQRSSYSDSYDDQDDEDGDGGGDGDVTTSPDQDDRRDTTKLTQDCFIIPAHKMDRFLPMQHEGNAQALSRLEIRDAKTCIVIDFGENSTFASQDLPSPVMGGPLSLAPKEWTSSQLGRQRKLFAWVRDSRCSAEGMLLMNVERHCQFPFVSYLVLNTGQGDPRRVISQLESEVNNGQTHEDHHIAGYEEVAAIARPPVDIRHPTKTACSTKTGYIISAFRVFPGEDREKLERSWLTWTGARQIYKRLPKHLGLRRIAFHKKIFPERGITYVLMCECTSLMDYVTEACCFVDQLRARCCGYTALYRVADFF